MEVRVQLPVLPRERTRGDDAALASLEGPLRPSQHLAVPLRDHPRIERGVKISNVVTKPVVERAVYRGACRFAVAFPFVGVLVALRGIAFRRATTRDAPPLAH